MRHKIRILLLAFFCGLFSNATFAQWHDDFDLDEEPSINLSGPRIGFTYIQGALATELRTRFDVSPLITQFGWQFETRFFTLDSGTTGLIEWVLLAGGLDQNVFLPSGTCLFGIRSPKGIEFGLGPNFSLAGVGFAFAAGVTMRSSHINFPINLAIVPSREGARVSVLVGFNKRKR